MSARYEVKLLSEYERTVSLFEKYNESYVLPEAFLIVRIDARRFGEEWTTQGIEYPFDEKLRQAFHQTAERLFYSGFKTRYAFHHGDEISLLLDESESTNLRKRGKVVSMIASAASVFFSQSYPLPVIFRSKLSELPTPRHVIDYFFWQRKIASRNFLSKTIGDILRSQGQTPQQIDAATRKLTEEERIQFATELGEDPSLWASDVVRGAGFWWECEEHGISRRFRVIRNTELPADDNDYFNFLLDRMDGPTHAPSEVSGTTHTKDAKPKPLGQNEYRVPSASGTPTTKVAVNGHHGSGRKKNNVSANGHHQHLNGNVSAGPFRIG